MKPCKDALASTRPAPNFVSCPLRPKSNAVDATIPLTWAAAREVPDIILYFLFGEATNTMKLYQIQQVFL